MANNNDEFVKEFGTKIKLFRTKNCLTQKKLADLMKVSTALISRLENGRSKCSVFMAIKIVKILDITSQELFE